MSILHNIAPSHNRNSTCRCHQRKKTHSGHHQKEWEQKYAGIIKPSPKGEEYTYCVPCCKSITVAVLGVYDLKSHLQTAGHKACLEKTKAFRPIDCHFKTHKQQSSTLESEVLFCQFVAEHNLPAAIADHFTYLVHRMFPDSEAAASFTFKHAKTSQVIKGSLAPAFTNDRETQDRTILSYDRREQ